MCELRNSVYRIGAVRALDWVVSCPGTAVVTSLSAILLLALFHAQAGSP